MGACMMLPETSLQTITSNAQTGTHSQRRSSLPKKESNANHWFRYPVCSYCSKHQDPQLEFQLVILGPGYTGKTSFRHHLVQKYGHAFCKADFLMYRDILQHNVLDLFRDILEPSLTVDELKRFVAYIHEQSGDVLQVLSADYCSAQFLSQMKQQTSAEHAAAAADAVLTHSLNILLTADECQPDDDDDEPVHQYQTLAQHSPRTPDVEDGDAFHLTPCQLQPVPSQTLTPCTSCTTQSASPTLTLSETYVSNSISLHEHEHEHEHEEQNTTIGAGAGAGAVVPVDTNLNRSKSLSALKPSSWRSHFPGNKHQRSLTHQVSAWFSALKTGNSRKSVDDQKHDCEDNEHADCEDEDDDDEVDEDDHFGIHSVYELMDRLNYDEFKYGRDNGRYLISNSHRILDDEFEPTFADLLHCHVRSTGLMFENHIQCKSLPVDTYDVDTHSQCKQDIVFKLVDVGGHRNERKKWQYVLSQDNDVIVYIASATSFCQSLFEDFQANAMQESLDVWTDIVSDARYRQHDNGTQFVLVINKIDLFEERYREFARYFPDYDGDADDKHEILAYIKRLYLDIAAEYGRTNVHCICTKMTDIHDVGCFETENVRHILYDYQHVMLNADIVDTILAYSAGDQFWSEQWLKPMWHNKLRKMEKLNAEKREKELAKQQNSRLSLQRIQQFWRTHES